MDRKPPDHRRLRNEEPPFTISQKQRWAKENLELKERLKAIESKMKEEGPWQDNIPEFNAERQIVRSYLYKRIRSQKLSKGSKATVQFLQQEIDRVS